MIEQVQISSGLVTSMDSQVSCRSCGDIINVERLFVAKAMVETPELLATLPNGDRQELVSLEQAQAVIERLDVTNPNQPVVQCASCGADTILSVSHYCRTMTVPAFLWCRCNQEVDLRYPSDRDRVRFMAKFPFMPFVNCRSCRKRMLLPPLGRDRWRMPLFLLLSSLRKIF